MRSERGLTWSRELTRRLRWRSAPTSGMGKSLAAAWAAALGACTVNDADPLVAAKVGAASPGAAAEAKSRQDSDSDVDGGGGPDSACGAALGRDVESDGESDAKDDEIADADCGTGAGGGGGSGETGAGGIGGGIGGGGIGSGGIASTGSGGVGGGASGGTGGGGSGGTGDGGGSPDPVDDRNPDPDGGGAPDPDGGGDPDPDGGGDPDPDDGGNQDGDCDGDYDGDGEQDIDIEVDQSVTATQSLPEVNSSGKVTVRAEYDEKITINKTEDVNICSEDGDINGAIIDIDQFIDIEQILNFDVDAIEHDGQLIFKINVYMETRIEERTEIDILFTNDDLLDIDVDQTISVTTTWSGDIDFDDMIDIYESATQTVSLRQHSVSRFEGFDEFTVSIDAPQGADLAQSKSIFLDFDDLVDLYVRIQQEASASQDLGVRLTGSSGDFVHAEQEVEVNQQLTIDLSPDDPLLG